MDNFSAGSNKPIEWAGHLPLSAPPPKAPCLPLMGSVRCPTLLKLVN